MRSVIIEAQTREEVMTEMEERMKRMEGVYSRRLMQEVRTILLILSYHYHCHFEFLFN